MNTVQQQQNVNQISNPFDQDKAAKQMSKKVQTQIKARTLKKLKELESESSDSSDDEFFAIPKRKQAAVSQAKKFNYRWGWDDDDFFGPPPGNVGKA